MTEEIIMMIVWLAVFLLALLVEIFTEALLSIWFCIGAVFALGVTFIPGMTWWGSLIVFFAISIISFLILKPMVEKNMLRIKSRTNADSLIGKKGILTKSIKDFEKGEVKLDGVLWTAIKRETDDMIQDGAVVEVIAIQGNKLLVKKVNS